MSKISYYPSADEPLQLSDRLIGTEAPRTPPSPTPLATKNFSLGELLDLFSSNFPAASLQAVLNTGNTATQNITLTGTITSTVMKPTNIEDTSGSQGTTFQILSKGASSINWINIPIDNLQAVLSAGSVATGNISLTGNITSTRIIPGNIQDDTAGIGTVGQVLSKTSTGIRWITNPASYTAGLADVLSVGNTATNDINLIGNVTATSFIKIGGTSLQFLMADGSVSTGPVITGFVPYTGATTNVDLGEYELKAGQVTLDTSPTGTAVVGTTRWNDTIGSSETTLKGGTVVLKNGVDLVARVVNKVTPNATLLRSNYTAVRISGAQGQRLAVAYAQANNDANSADTIGLVCENIATNQEGFILTVGQLEEINTTGSLQGETWADGDVLYLSPTTAGRLTNIKPTGATGHIVVIGYVEYAHAVHGKIYVKIMNGWELDELHNVYINPATLANNDGLFYDSSDQLWKNETIASALGYTPFQLPALTSGSVLFSNGTTIAQKNANFFWDNTNNRLGINNPTPTNPLTIGPLVAASLQASSANFYASKEGASNDFTLVAAGDNALFRSVFGGRKSRGTLLSPTAVFGGDAICTFISGAYDGAAIQSSAALSFDAESAASVGNAPQLINFITGSTGANRTTKMQVRSNGNVLINTTTDAGFRLDVNGTARVQGALTVSTGGADITTGTSTTFIRRSSTLHLGIGIAVDGAADFRINGTTKFYIGASATNSLEIPHTLRVAFVNPGVATFSNILWDNTNTEFRFVNGANSDTVNLRTSRFICSNISNTFNSSAQLQVDSTTRGFLPPRMTTTQKNAIATPAAGLVVYDTTLNKLCVRTASAWETITSS
jgi:nitrogen fixation protein